MNVDGGGSPGEFGPQNSDSQGPSRFSRWDLSHPDRSLEITVFPHGYAGFFPDKICGIARPHGLVGSINPVDECSEERILSVDPWNVHVTEMPKGYRPGWRGKTTFAVSRWEINVVEGSLLDWAFGQSRTIRAFMDLSYVSWRFYEGCDFETSIVAKIVPLHEGEITSADIAALAGKARSFMTDLQNWLEISPIGDLEKKARPQSEAEYRRLSEPPLEPELPPPQPQPPTGPDAVAVPPKLVEVSVTVQFPKNRR